LTILPETILPTTLQGYYAPSACGTLTIERNTLIGMLQKLPALSAQAHTDSITEQLNRHHLGISLSVEDQAMIMFVDDFLSKILKQIDMALVAVEALTNDLHTLLQPLKLFDLLGALIKECLGWSEDLGILGETYIEKTEAVLLPLSRGKVTPDECLRQLKNDLHSERRRQQKLEQNLTRAEPNNLITDSA
jgi:hypothetical protein